MSRRIRVLFVCLGNICRSPVAEGVFLDRVRRRGLDHHFEVDSAGLGGWHAGELPDERSVRVAARHGVILPSRARRIEPEELDETHWIVCMDEGNRRGLERIGAPAERVRLLKSFAPRPIGRSHEVDDPYEEGPDAFDRMFQEISEAVESMIDRLVETHGLAPASGARQAAIGAADHAPREAGGDREPADGA